MGTLVNDTTMTQCDMVLAHMMEHGSISQLEAAEEYGCWRLAARISDLRKAGYAIKSHLVTKKNRMGRPVSFARYTLEEVGNEGM